MTDHSPDAVLDRCGDAYHDAKLTFSTRSPMHCALSALQPGDQLPNGNVVVPSEPSEKMILAGQRSIPGPPKWTLLTGESVLKRWRAMIEAIHD